MRSWAVLLGAVASLVAVSAHAVKIEVGSVEARRGEDVEIPVYLDTRGQEVIGVGNRLDLDPEVRPLECKINPIFVRSGGLFQFGDEKCSRGFCESIRAELFSWTELSAVEADSPIYTCQVRVEPTARPGKYRVLCLFPNTTDGETAEHGTVCAHGVIEVSDAPPVPTRHLTPTPTLTPYPTPLPQTPSPKPNSTATSTPDSSHQVYLSATSTDIPADRGGRVEIIASVRDSNRVPLPGVHLEFDVQPPIGDLSFDTNVTDFVEWNGWFYDGHVKLALDIPATGEAGSIEVTAISPSGSGSTEIRLYTGGKPVPEPIEEAHEIIQYPLIFMETSHLSIDARSGAEITVWAHIFHRGGGISGADPAFDVFPPIAELGIVSGRTGRLIEIDGSRRYGVAEATLFVPAGSTERAVQVAGIWRHGIGQASVPINDEPAKRAREIVVQLGGPECVVPDPHLYIDVVAQVTDTEGDPVDGFDVLFESDLAVPWRQVRKANASGGAATITLGSRDTPPQRIDNAGEAVPYTIKARTGGIEGIAHVYVRSDGAVCRSAAAALGDPNDDDSGCAVGGASGNAWPLALVGILLWARARRLRETCNANPIGVGPR